TAVYPGKQRGIPAGRCQVRAAVILKPTRPQAMARLLRLAIRGEQMRRPIILATSILMTVATEGFAQPTEQAPTVRELLSQLEEMRSQMVTMQNRIATLEAATGIPGVRSQPDETP